MSAALAPAPLFGLALFGLALGLMLWARWPVYAALIACSVWGGAAGMLLGWVEPGLVQALPIRLSGLLEHDLLQALLLYALLGAGLRELGLAQAWIAAVARRLGGGPRASALAVLGFAALSAPMNGSVAASLAMLRRGAGPALAGWPPARASALLAAASTLGLLLPPSLVLLLCSDAMMRAHTEALGRLGASAGLARVMNNQDLLWAAWRPAGLVLLGFALLILLRRPAARASPDPRQHAATTAWQPLAFTLLVLLMLAGVVQGWWLAVEAAAMSGCALLAAGIAGGALKGRLRALLAQAMQTAGLLFGLLVGATSFTWLLRALGSDAWLQRALEASPWGPGATLALALAVLLLCGLVLDAFELIFLVLPLLMPPLLTQQPHAPWVAVLALLVLQLGYLLPPLGYALLAVRGQAADRADTEAPPPLHALAREAAPYAAVIAMVLAAVLAWPQALCGPPPRLDAPTLSDEEAMQELLRQAEPPASVAGNE
ncbi:TRAP transporter large permease subunit [Pelomonas sp. CA6]|uniref:TRAP transporter large permease subunit n=1 Tax=Pelomonas sp. CA6 TaxID=2907999 RepID=UPI001F4A2D48|nr:TRAP transporter large permease subunit [Pelomonas sp. CA6]MCH7341985.1 TRAP transporter large permease subunit [Pelomonas sp. CA6]